MVASETAITKKKLKIKFGNQRIEAVSYSREYEQQLPVSANGHCYTATNESNHLEMTKSQQASNGKRMLVSEFPKERSSNLAGKKREQSELVEGPKEKRRKMDRSVTQQCSSILKALMGHPSGWVFSQPVDPVKLNIPDYFSIISKPMDLGTIKSRLAKNVYSGTEEFVADVRLTFSNAMLYNPPQNNVHQMAVVLNDMFEMRWKSLEEKLSCDKPKVGLKKISNGKMTEVSGGRHTSPKTPPLCSTLSFKKLKTSEGKVVRSLSHVREAEVGHSKLAQSCSGKLVLKNLQKGSDGGGRLACSVVNAKSQLSPVTCQRCSKCGNPSCGCSLSSDSTHASSDITSERTLVGDYRSCSADASKTDCQAKSTSTSKMSKSDPDSDGAVSAFDDGNLCPSSQLTPPASDSTSAAGWTASLDIQMSPKKALRAAMLKSRFADTILKAQKKTLLDHIDKADPVKLQQEKERLEKIQREEKARIEAQIKAAEAASRMQAEIECKKQREKDREAARIALEKIERTVEIEHNVEIMKELEKLTGCCLLRGRCGSKVSEKAHKQNPLEQFGLVLKNEYVVGYDDEEILHLNEDGEEGEIL